MGFTAYAPDGDSHYTYNDIIIFDSTVSNFGGYYQTSSSQFLCPADGMYAFSLNIITARNERFLSAIMKESLILDSVYGDLMNGYANAVSNMIITVCSKGERVWIRSLTDKNAVHNKAYGFTTFSGFLLNRL